MDQLYRSLTRGGIITRFGVVHDGLAIIRRRIGGINEVREFAMGEKAANLPLSYRSKQFTFA